MGKVYLVAGNRIPFLRSGTNYMDFMNYQLGGFAIRGLLDKTGLSPALVDNVIMGCVIHNMKTPNVAREAALSAGISPNTPCHTVSQACISANQAISEGFNLISMGKADAIIAGGTDSASDTPIGFQKKMRKKLFNAQKLKGFGDTLKFVFSLRPSDFAPEKPAIAEYTTNRSMGQDCEILTGKFQITRQEQDDFAARSHQLTAKAWEDGYLGQDVSKVEIPPKFNAIAKDNGFRGDSTAEKMAKLRPAFDKKNGTITAANASFLTDGAAAVLLMSEKGLEKSGLKPMAEVVDYCFTGQDLHEALLMGPAYAIAKLLKANQLTFSDIDVFEIHEAFAGQVLANLKALASDEFCQAVGHEKALGAIPMEKLNTWGGSLSIGHPFGATGARLVTTAARRLHAEGGKIALLAACAAGAHGTAMLIKKV